MFGAQEVLHFNNPEGLCQSDTGIAVFFGLVLENVAFLFGCFLFSVGGGFPGGLGFVNLGMAGIGCYCGSIASLELFDRGGCCDNGGGFPIDGRLKCGFDFGGKDGKWTVRREGVRHGRLFMGLSLGDSCGHFCSWCATNMGMGIVRVWRI